MKSVKVVIIEDEADFAKLIGRCLDGLADSVATFSDWIGALQHIDTYDDDVAWVDLRMPTSSEEDSIKHIAELRSRNKRIVIVVGSGYITAEVRAELDRAGADGCFYKTAEFKAEQVASLIVLGMMRANMRYPNGKLLERALAWMKVRFPNAAEIS